MHGRREPDSEAARGATARKRDNAVGHATPIPVEKERKNSTGINGKEEYTGGERGGGDHEKATISRKKAP